MKRLPLFSILSILCIAAAIGCGGSSESDKGNADKGGGDNTPTYGGIQVAEIPLAIPVKELVQLDDGFRLQPQDDGRVTIQTPVGWVPGQRKENYLIWFVKANSAIIPHIYVTAEDAAEGAQFTLTKENVVDFAKAVKQRLDDTGRVKKLLEREIYPLMIGDAPCVRYVISDTIRAGASTEKVETQVLITVHKGRQYTVGLRVDNADELLANKNAAYAVLAGLKFDGAATTTPD